MQLLISCGPVILIIGKCKDGVSLYCVRWKDPGIEGEEVKTPAVYISLYFIAANQGKFRNPYKAAWLLIWLHDFFYMKLFLKYLSILRSQ